MANSLVGEMIRALTESKTCFLAFGGLLSSPESELFLSSSEELLSYAASNFCTFFTKISRIGNPKHNVLP